MKIKIIGDVHGKFSVYEQIVKQSDTSIQIGDFGVNVHWNKLKRHKIDSTRHKIIPGNHDDYDFIINSIDAKNWTFGKDYGNINFYDLEFFMLRGAYSIDKKYRTPKWDWWEEEQLTENQLDEAVNLYTDTKPEIMITHECPGDIFSGISTIIFGCMIHINRTAISLQRMWNIHKPVLWVFGHWHKTGIWEINETTFICLNELDFIEYDTELDITQNIIKIKEQLT